jgi:hypothetical protein
MERSNKSKCNTADFTVLSSNHPVFFLRTIVLCLDARDLLGVLTGVVLTRFQEAKMNI